MFFGGKYYELICIVFIAVHIHSGESVTNQFNKKIYESRNNESSSKSSLYLSKLNPSMCISDEALLHTKHLIETKVTQKQLSRYDSSLPNKFPRIITTDYRGSIFNHNFVLHAYPEYQEMQDCYLLLGEDKDKLQDLNENSEEFQNGCIIFRDRARTLQDFVVCTEDLIFHKTSLFFHSIDRVKFLTKFAYFASSMLIELPHRPEVYVDGFTNFMENFFRHTFQIDYGSKFYKYLVNKCIYHNIDTYSKKRKFSSLEEDQKVPTTIKNDAATIEPEMSDDLKKSILCMGPMTGGSGVMGNGIAIHDESWVKSLDATQSVNGFPAPKTDQVCNIHPVCARLASTELLNFSHTTYRKFMPSLRTLGSVPSLDYCKKVTESNCRLHTQCWIAAVREVCSKYSFCCPSLDVHEACKANVNSSECAGSLCMYPRGS